MDKNSQEERCWMFLKLSVNYLQLVETVSGELISKEILL
jgi:hypothetical protein